MLTKELIEKQEALKGLTQEQVTAIVTLSENDENVVIANKVSEFATRIEQDFEAVTGIKKDPNEKYYDYIKRGGKTLKEHADQGGKVSEYQEKITALEKQLKEKSSDPALKSRLDELQQQLTDEKARVSELQQLTEASKKDYEAKLGEKDSKFLEYRAQLELMEALKGKTPKAGLSQEVFGELVDVRIRSLLGKYTPELVQTSSGEVMQWRDSEGKILNNEQNGLAPFTSKELALNEVADIIDAGKKQNGTGTSSGKPSGSNRVISINGAKTKQEATEAIRQGLAAQGIAATDPKYQDAFDKAYKEVPADLPLR